MKGNFIAIGAVAGLVALLTPTALFSAPNPQLKITIKGGRLARHIEIAGTEPLSRFFFGSGPGNSVWIGPSFIVDWPQGIASAPADGLAFYDVEFLTSRTGMNTYRVTYAYDPGKKIGFVYLPGVTDPRYRENTWLILRGNEGNWFHSWSEWDAFAGPLLENGQ